MLVDFMVTQLYLDALGGKRYPYRFTIDFLEIINRNLFINWLAIVMRLIGTFLNMGLIIPYLVIPLIDQLEM